MSLARWAKLFFVIFVDASVISCNVNVAQLYIFLSTDWHQQNGDINRVASIDRHHHSEINRVK